MANAKRTKKSVAVPIEAIVIIAVIALLIGLFIGLFVLHFMGKNNSEKEADSAPAERVEVNVPDGELIDYEESGNITIGEYKGVSTMITPEQDEIYSSMQEKAQSKKIQKKLAKDNKIQKGDYIFINYEGTVNGASNDDLRAEDACLQVGKYEYVEDFENGLIGKEIGKTHIVTVKFDEGYDDEIIAGQKVVFSIKVLGKFDDAYAKEASGGKCKTVGEYMEYLKKKLKKENQENIAELAWDALLDSCKVKEYPESLVESVFKDLQNQYTNFAKVSGSTYEKLLASLGMEENDVQEMAKDTVRDHMIAKTIAKREKLDFNDEIYQTYLMKTMEYDKDDNMSLETLVSEYKRDYGGRPKDDMLVEIAKEFVGDNAKQK
ncbi:MAG: FKBP-type peptidyl-prolyl cis-trans isomerase [Lachnospiraceae bacterium]|nr:FKBP-type peptidyl-prolyl cis-trans isomerase [Lachnospiraceae bacterium]